MFEEQVTKGQVNTKSIKKKIKSHHSDSHTDEFVPKIFEVNVKNRVVKKGSGKRIKGVQGGWYDEKIYWVADNEENLPLYIKDHIRSRRILGKPKYRLNKYIRAVEILKIRRII